ncbi:hypothetical protein JX266_011597 [Neoarthrinium moseri]|nr:hypothetical protein JX266_011597 [Neoarthrinium moseri]
MGDTLVAGGSARGSGPEGNPGHDDETQLNNGYYRDGASLILAYFNCDLTKDFYKEIPLHSHPGNPTPHGKSEVMNPNEPDNPWILSHPQAFNLANEPHGRFNFERVETACIGKFSLYVDVVYEYSTLARSLSLSQDGDAQFAIRDDEGRIEAFVRDFPGFSEYEVTVQDLLMDEVLIRQMPEFMVWLAYGPKHCAHVTIRTEQADLYKRWLIRHSGWMQLRRAQSIWDVQWGKVYGPIPSAG